MVNSHALLTRPPLSTKPKFSFSLDLHVLGVPPTFTLSQDQTLKFDLVFPSFEGEFYILFRGNADPTLCVLVIR